MMPKSINQILDEALDRNMIWAGPGEMEARVLETTRNLFGELIWKSRCSHDGCRKGSISLVFGPAATGKSWFLLNEMQYEILPAHALVYDFDKLYKKFMTRLLHVLMQARPGESVEQAALRALGDEAVLRNNLMCDFSGIAAGMAAHPDNSYFNLIVESIAWGNHAAFRCERYAETHILFATPEKQAERLSSRRQTIKRAFYDKAAAGPVTDRELLDLRKIVANDIAWHMAKSRRFWLWDVTPDAPEMPNILAWRDAAGHFHVFEPDRIRELTGFAASELSCLSRLALTGEERARQLISAQHISVSLIRAGGACELDRRAENLRSLAAQHMSPADLACDRPCPFPKNGSPLWCEITGVSRSLSGESIEFKPVVW